MGKEKVIMSWSGGKDSSYALHQLLQDERYEVVGLLTTLFTPTQRVSMHGTPLPLVERQADCIGLPLHIVRFDDSTYTAYEDAMKDALSEIKTQGVKTIAFGDIYLEDLKEYREKKLEEVGMTALFPLWKKDTKTLSQLFIQEGFKTHICSIDLAKVPEELVGVDYSINFLAEIDDKTDPCGENGEFHSFCYDGPIFNKRVNFQINGISEQTYEHNEQEYKYLFSNITP